MLLLTEVERGEEHREAEHHGGDVLLAAAAHRPALGQDLVEHHVEDGARGHPWVQGQCCSVQIICVAPPWSICTGSSPLARTAQLEAASVRRMPTREPRAGARLNMDRDTQ